MFTQLRAGQIRSRHANTCQQVNPTDSISERFWETKPVEELYDTWSRPRRGCEARRARRAHKRLDAFRTILDRHCADVYDSGFIPEGSSAEGYDAARDSRPYPVSAVQNWRASRFTAIRTLFHGLSPLWMRTTSSCATGVPFVLVAIAEAYAWTGGDPVAVDRLINLAGPDHDWRVRVAAFNALTYLPEPACSALTVAEAALDDDNEYVRGAARYLRLVLGRSTRPTRRSLTWNATVPRVTIVRGTVTPRRNDDARRRCHARPASPYRG